MTAVDHTPNNAYEQADANCKGPHWPESAKPTREQIDHALAAACVAHMLPPSELKRRHDCDDHAICPPYWCDHVTPDTPEVTR